MHQSSSRCNNVSQIHRNSRCSLDFKHPILLASYPLADAELICLPSGSIEVTAPEPRPADGHPEMVPQSDGIEAIQSMATEKKSYERKVKSYYSRLMVNYAILSFRGVQFLQYKRMGDWGLATNQGI